MKKITGAAGVNRILALPIFSKERGLCVKLLLQEHRNLLSNAPHCKDIEMVRLKGGYFEAGNYTGVDSVWRTVEEWIEKGGGIPGGRRLG